MLAAANAGVDSCWLTSDTKSLENHNKRKALSETVKFC